MEDFEDFIATDEKIFDAIHKEVERQRSYVNLIASENVAPANVREAQGSVLTNKYAEGYPGKRYYGGCENVDYIEKCAIETAKRVFNAEFANVQPHCGSSANLAVYRALLEMGDTILSMSLVCGGHLTHGASVSFSGKDYNIVHYGVNDEGFIDYDEVERLALENKPKLILAGGSAYSRIIDFKRFREIADKVGAYFMVDMAHFAGLVAARLYPNPCDYADVVTCTTHKTLRGPRGGLILAKEQFGKKINSAVFPGTQGGPLEHVIAAKAICFGNCLTEKYVEYQQSVIDTAGYMAYILNRKYGIKILTGGTDTHLFMIDLRGMDITGREVQERLERCHIIVNKNTVPNDPRTPVETSGVRIGTPFICSQGINQISDINKICEVIAKVVHGEQFDEEAAALDMEDLVKPYTMSEF